MKLTKDTLKVLQQMMGEEGSVFNRNLFLNHWHGEGPEHCRIFPDIMVGMAVFEELKQAHCIKLHTESYCRDQYVLTNAGRKVLKDAGMETKEGKLTRDDVEWLLGVGYYGQ